MNAEIGRGLAAVGLVGCAMAGGGAQPVLKAPVTSRREKVGLDGCPDLVDGAIAYAEGDPQAGEKALNHAHATTYGQLVKTVTYLSSRVAMFAACSSQSIGLPVTLTDAPFAKFAFATSGPRSVTRL